MVTVGHEGAIPHDVTLGAHNTYKSLEFIQAHVIPSLDRQGSSSCTMFRSTYLVKYNKLLNMLDTSTSTSVCHHIVHFSILQNEYLDTSKTMSNIKISKIIAH